jgi:hypothetical protein
MQQFWNWMLSQMGQSSIGGGNGNTATATVVSWTPGPSPSGGTWNPPGVPRHVGNIALAAGGLVTRPTFALVGESGPEAVIPLNKVKQLGGYGGTQPINVIIQTPAIIGTGLDKAAREMAPMIRKEIIKTQRRNANSSGIQ